MAPRQPKTKEDALIDIGNELIKTLRSSKGLLTIDTPKLKKLSTEAQKNKDGDPAKYWAINSFISMLKGDYSNAYKHYKNAWILNSNSFELMLNYPALLFRLNYFEELQTKTLGYLKQNPNVNQFLTQLVNTSYILLDTEVLSEALDVFKARDELDRIISYKGSEAINFIPKFKDMLNEIELEKNDYVESMMFLNSFISKNTLESYISRLSVELNNDEFVRVEVFFEITSEQALHLNKEFDDCYIKYSMEEEAFDRLSKFIVYFKPRSDIKDERKDIHSTFIVDEDDGQLVT